MENSYFNSIVFDDYDEELDFDGNLYVATEKEEAELDDDIEIGPCQSIFPVRHNPKVDSKRYDEDWDEIDGYRLWINDIAYFMLFHRLIKPHFNPNHTANKTRTPEFDDVDELCGAFDYNFFTYEDMKAIETEFKNLLMLVYENRNNPDVFDVIDECYPIPDEDIRLYQTFTDSWIYFSSPRVVVEFYEKFLIRLSQLLADCSDADMFVLVRP